MRRLFALTMIATGVCGSLGTASAKEAAPPAATTAVVSYQFADDAFTIQVGASLEDIDTFAVGCLEHEPTMNGAALDRLPRRSTGPGRNCRIAPR